MSFIRLNIYLLLALNIERNIHSNEKHLFINKKQSPHHYYMTQL